MEIWYIRYFRKYSRFCSVNVLSYQIEEEPQTSSPKEAPSEKPIPKGHNEGSITYGIANIKEYKVKNGDTRNKLASDAGISWQDLAVFNWATEDPDQVNRFLYSLVGCRKRLIPPTKSKTKKKSKYVFTSDDDPGIIFIPQQWSLDGLITEAAYELRLRRRYYFSPVAVQAVDEFGLRYGNVTLVLKSMNGFPDVEIKTDNKGYGEKKKVLSGDYKIFVKEMGPAFFMKDLDRLFIVDPATNKKKFGKYTEAVFSTENMHRSILRVVVSMYALTETTEYRLLIKQTYLRTDKKVKIEGSGEETEGYSRQSLNVCVDNLVLAAGWLNEKEVNIKRLVSDTMKSYLNDYTPIYNKIGYHIFIIEPSLRKISLFNKSGQIEKIFTLTQEISGGYGAYGSFPDVDEILYRDFASTTHNLYNPADQYSYMALEDIIHTSELKDFDESMKSHWKEETIIILTPDAGQLAWIALHGGTGRLEDYGGDDSVRKSIHKRNIDVCHRIRDVYNGYIDNYKKKVLKAKNEDEIRNLNAPLSPYEMPAPAGATQSQLIDIFNASITRELEAWVAIGDQLDEINDNLAKGHPYIRIKFKFKVGNLLNHLKDYVGEKYGFRNAIPKVVTDHMNADAEVEWNLYGIIKENPYFFHKKDISIKVKIRADPKTVVKYFLKPTKDLENLESEEIKEEFEPKKPLRRFIEVGFQDYMFNPEKHKVYINICDLLKLETDTLGKSKASVPVIPLMNADIELNPTIGTIATGVTFSGRDLASKLKKLSPNKWGKIRDFLELVEFQVLIGFRGAPEETYLAILSFAPGFFERRNIDTFFKKGMKWNDLKLYEATNLGILGWDQESWDSRDCDLEEITVPRIKEKIKNALEVANKPRYELKPEEKIAIIHLGFDKIEDYGQRFRNAIKNWADFDDG